MEIKSETLDDHQVKLTVEIEHDRFEQVKRRAARKISRGTKIPGFRPGKAPYQVIQRHVGEAAVLEEALDTLIEEIYPEILDRSEIQPYGPGTLDDVTSTDPPVLEFRVPLAPEVLLGDYREIRQPYEPAEITDADVQEVLERVQQDQAILEVVERPVQQDDVVYLSLEAHEVLESGELNVEKPLVPQRKLNLRVRSEEEEAEDEWPFPGFSAQLVEQEQGQEHSIDHEFPDEERFENFQGKQVRFAYQINEVKIRELPDLNDEFAQSVGDYETLEALRAFIRESLETQRLSEYHQEYDDELLDKIVADAKIKYPPQMVERELEILKQDLEDRLAAENLDMSIYLKTREISEEDLAEELRPVALRRIERGLVLMEVADQEKIEVQPKDVEADVSRTIDQFYQLMPEKEVRQRLTTDAIQNLVSQMIGDRMTALTVERLRDIARGAQPEETEQPQAEAEKDQPSDVEMSTEDPSAPAEAEVEPEAAEAPAAEGSDIAEAAEIEPVEAASKSE